MIGFGVLGGNSYVATRALIPAIDASAHALLVSICSRSGVVDPRWIADSVEDYDDVISDPAVDVVYIALPNGMHRQWAERCMAAGKHVLCEKPLAANLADATAMAAAAEQAGVELFEAWMTPYAPRWRTAVRMATDGTIGELRRIESTFTFTIGRDSSDNYRWDPAQGGGALLDVGNYVIGPAVHVWDAHPDHIEVTRTLRDDPAGRGAVDATSEIVLTWADGRRLDAVASFERPECQRLRFIGTTGSVELREEAHTMDPSARDLWVDGGDGPEQVFVPGADPYRAMIADVASTIAENRAATTPIGDAIDRMALFDRIAAH